MTYLSRRALIQSGAAAGAGLATQSGFALAKAVASVDAANRSADSLASDEEFWLQIARAYELDGRYIVLNGGGNNPIPQSVVAALTRYDELAASQPRPHNYVLQARITDHRKRLAGLMNCDAEEVAITRNTTEGLNIVGWGLDLKQGDEVLISSYEHNYAAEVFEQRAARHGIRVRTVELPVSPSVEDVLQRFQKKMTGKTRLLVASHVVDGWGFVLPIRELSKLAHENGAQLLADGALGFGQIPVDVRELGCDYYATSLHKWLNAPLGTGALYIRRDRITDLWPLYGNRKKREDIRKFEDVGTRCGPTIAAIGQALDFYQLIGPVRKAERFKYLSGLVLNALKDAPNIQTFTESDPKKRTGLARISIAGISGADLTERLRNEHAIYTWGNFPGKYDGVYCSPNVFNTAVEMSTFVDALKDIARSV